MGNTYLHHELLPRQHKGDFERTRDAQGVRRFVRAVAVIKNLAPRSRAAGLVRQRPQHHAQRRAAFREPVPPRVVRLHHERAYDR